NHATTSSHNANNKTLNDAATDPEVGHPNSSQSTSEHPLIPDPFNLLSRKIPDAELQKWRKDYSLKGHRRKLYEFYTRQNELIDDLLSPIGEEMDTEEEAKQLVKLQIAIWGSAGVNVLLMGLQLYAAISSGSLALFATMADAFMDLASSAVILFTTIAASKKDLYKFPTGKRRFETAGIIVFSCIMGALSVQLIIEAAKSLIAQKLDVDLKPMTLVCIGTAIALKLGLYLYCSALSKYPSARIFAQDHRNDIVLNTFGIALSIVGEKVIWWADPVGAIIIATLILRSWGETAMEHIQMIVGKSASPLFLARVTYIALIHSPEILHIDTVRAYHSGAGYFVEVDIVLPPEMDLRRAHD
ncbi:hypothetical protein HDV05_000761, partial [Chytridiales sp. JEL 0842]